MYPEILQVAQHIVDKYVQTGDVDTAAKEIKNYYFRLNPSRKDIPEYFIGFYLSNSNSDLPILLLYKLGLLPSYVENNPVPLNEWKALLDAGIDLCNVVNDHTYLYYLIANPKLWNAEEIPFTENDILANIAIHPDCYPLKDLREINALIRQRVHELTKTRNRLDHWERILVGLSRDTTGFTTEELRKLIQSTNENIRRSTAVLSLIGNVLNQYPSEYPGKTVGRQISSFLSSMPPRGRFPGGSEYRQGLELGREHFIAEGGQDILRELQDLGRMNSEDISWEQLLTIAGRLGILPVENPNELRNLIIQQSPQSRYADWEELLEIGNELNLFYLPTERSGFLKYLMDYTTQL